MCSLCTLPDMQVHQYGVRLVYLFYSMGISMTFCMEMSLEVIYQVYQNSLVVQVNQGINWA